jgi:sterol desaturase/sphingolipid hydroxylase (fatty acid hydroxylase superfamily)
MNAHAYFEPSLYAWVDYCAKFCLRYFVLAGGFYWLLHVRFRSRWASYRIQEKFPGRDQIRHEIAWSMANAAATGAATVLTYALIHAGRTAMYFDLAAYGWPYLLLSAALAVVGYDTWNYWQHRMLHTPWWFRHVHWVHHRVGNPTAFATFAAHPVETFMGNAFFVLFVIVVPVHPLALAAAGAYLFVYGTLCHTGYEFFPRWVARHPFLGVLNNATYHNIHHSRVGSNFGGWFIYWDRLMGTRDPGYYDAFDAVTARRSAPAPR